MFVCVCVRSFENIGPMGNQLSGKFVIRKNVKSIYIECQQYS